MVKDNCGHPQSPRAVHVGRANIERAGPGCVDIHITDFPIFLGEDAAVAMFRELLAVFVARLDKETDPEERRNIAKWIEDAPQWGTPHG